MRRDDRLVYTERQEWCGVAGRPRPPGETKENMPIMSRRLPTRHLCASLVSFVLAGVMLSGCRPGAVVSGQAPSPSSMAAPSPTLTAANVSACQTSQLALASHVDGLTLGHAAATYSLANRSQQACALHGYPDVQLLDAQRRLLPTHEQRTSMAYTFTVPPPQSVVVRPGASAYFHLEWPDAPATGQPPTSQSCPVAAFIRVTPPLNATSLVISATMAPCGGNVITSPVEATAAAF
jgi:hypothetical protein